MIREPQLPDEASLDLVTRRLLSKRREIVPGTIPRDLDTRPGIGSYLRCCFGLEDMWYSTSEADRLNDGGS